MYSNESNCRKQIAYYLFHAGLLLGLFFDPEDRGDMLLWNVSCLSMDYTMLYPTRKLFITTAVRTSEPSWTMCLQNHTTRPHPKPLQLSLYVHVNIGLPFISKSPKWASYKASHHSFAWISCLVYAAHVLRSTLSRFKHHTNIKVKISLFQAMEAHRVARG
jgi:hypothetical protein